MTQVLAESPLIGVMIRDGRDSDGEELMHFIAGVWAEYPDKRFDFEHSAAEYAAIATGYASRGGCLWIAIAEGKIVGSIALAPADEAPGVELQKLYVAKPYRRSGLGGHLCMLLEAEARRREAPFVDLWSDVKLVDAHNLYESLGYVRGSNLRHYDDLNATARYYYRKPLTPVA